VGAKVGLLHCFIVGMFGSEAWFIGVIAPTSRSIPKLQHYVGRWHVSTFRGQRRCRYGRKSSQSWLPDCPGAKEPKLSLLTLMVTLGRLYLRRRTLPVAKTGRCVNYARNAEQLWTAPRAAKEPEMLFEAIATGSVVSWQHINLQGNTISRAESFQDSVAIKPPKLAAWRRSDFGSSEKTYLVEYNSLRNCSEWDSPPERRRQGGIVWKADDGWLPRYPLVTHCRSSWVLA